MIIIDVVNIVASAKIKAIDVALLAKKIPCIYIPSRFAALVMSIPKSKMVNVNVYSGAMTSTGAGNTKDALSAMDDAVRSIGVVGTGIEFLEEPKISNIVAVVYPGTDEMPRDEVSKDGAKIPFFSQVKTKDEINGATILIAKSGRVTITGVRSLSDVIGAAKRLFHKV